MCRIDALGVVAFVAHQAAKWDWSMMREPHCAMGKLHSIASFLCEFNSDKPSVSVLVLMSSPFPALALKNNLCQ